MSEPYGTLGATVPESDDYASGGADVPKAFREFSDSLGEGQGSGKLLIVQSTGAAAWKAMSGDVSINSSGVTQIGNKSITLAKLAEAVAQALVPVSAVIGLRTTTVPSGFLLCDGSAVSRTTYAALFAAIEIEEGGGDGSTTFNLPDYRGRLLAGKGTHADVNALTDNDGLAVGSRTPKHLHEKGSLAMGKPTSGQVVNAGSLLGMADNEHVHPITGSTATASGAYAVLNWIIKY